ncbi:hypothetical protein AYJ58_15685 [Shewanella sp. Pdp11]|nr:hypothetical protein AYJ58_15685 [Shewanella sp. Pdp11]
MQHYKCYFNCYLFVNFDAKCFFAKGMRIINVINDGFLVLVLMFFVKFVNYRFVYFAKLFALCFYLLLVKSYFFIIFIEKIGNFAYLVSHSVSLQVCLCSLTLYIEFHAV